MIKDKSITGYLQQQQSYEKDVDYYKINIAEKGTLKLDFKHENFDEKEWFIV